MKFPQLGVLVLALSLSLMVGCTTTDPYTGETQVDTTATAGAVAGLAILGAAAYAASSDDDDDRHEYYRRNYDYDDDRLEISSYSPRSGVICHRHSHSCYQNGHYSSKWTRREFN